MNENTYDELMQIKEVAEKFGWHIETYTYDTNSAYQHLILVNNKKVK